MNFQKLAELRNIAQKTKKLSTLVCVFSHMVQMSSDWKFEFQQIGIC